MNEEIRIDGLRHKIGHNGMAFVFIGDEWVRGHKTAEDIRQAQRKLENRTNLPKYSKECIA